MDIDLETRAGHSLGGADAVLLVHDEILRKHVKNLAPGRQRHGLGRIDGAPDIVASDLAVLACNGDHSPAVEPFDVRSRERKVHEVDFDTSHQLGFLDRLLDGVDGSLEIDDHTALDASRLGNAHPDDIETAVLEAFADDAGDRRCADVEAYYVLLSSSHLNSLRS